MTSQHLVYSVAHQIKSDLINKVEKFITRREAVMGQINNYTLDRLANIFAHTNQQIAYNVNKSSITEIQDLVKFPVDKFMSVPDDRVTKVKILQPHFSKFSSIKQTTKISIDNSKRDSQKSRSMTPQSKSIPAKKSNHSSMSKIVQPQPLTIEKPQDQARYVQVLRQVKKVEQQERHLKEMKIVEASKRMKINNDWSNKKVMYDFQCKPIKMQEIKPQKYLNIGCLQPKVNPKNNVSNSFRSKERRDQINQQAKDKVNITRKAQQDQEAKLRRKGLFKPNQSNKSQPQPAFFIVNLSSHEQIENAIKLESNGIKIKLNARQLSTKTEPSETSKITINSKINRTQYFEFKGTESHRKNGIMISQTKHRSKSEMKARTDYSNDNEMNDKGQGTELKLKAKISLLRFNCTRRDSNRSNQSQVKIYNGQIHRQLLNTQEQKHVSFETSDKQNTSEKVMRQELSEVDRYNLMYIKYNGNPPPDCLQSLTETLKTSTLTATKQRQNLLKTGTSKKYNWINSSRIIDKKKQKTYKSTG